MPRGPSPVVLLLLLAVVVVLARSPLLASLSLLSLSLSLSMRMRTCLMREARVRSCTRTPTRAPSGMRAGMACDGMTRTTCTHARCARTHTHSAALVAALRPAPRLRSRLSALPPPLRSAALQTRLSALPSLPCISVRLFSGRMRGRHMRPRARARRRCRRGTHNLWPRRSGTRDGCAPLRRPAPRGARAHSPWRLKLACLLACLYSI